MTILWQKKLIKVSSEANNNKFWNISFHDNGTMIREWGRVGSSSTPQEEPSTEKKALGLLNKKLKDGYKEVAILENDNTVKNQNLKELAVSQLLKNNCSETKELIEELVETNIHNILSNTNLSYNSNSGLFSTPMGVVSTSSIKQATQILKDISLKTQASQYDSEWKKLCEEYLMIIPHKVGSKLNLNTIFGSIQLINDENNILKSLESSVELIRTNALKVDSGEEEDLFDVHLGLVNDPKIIDYVKEKFIRNIYKNHPSAKLKVNRVFDMNIKSMTDEFMKIEEDIGNTRKLWHGTRAGNLLSILHKGMIIQPSSSQVVTGRMFGNGLYFSDISTKALNYSYGTWNKVGLSKKRRYYALICNVLLGKQFLADQTYFNNSNYYPKKGYNSTFAKSGTLGLLNNEMIVYNSNQVAPRYLVEFTE